MRHYDLIITEEITPEYTRTIEYFQKSFLMTCFLLRNYTRDGYNVTVVEVKDV